MLVTTQKIYPVLLLLLILCSQAFADSTQNAERAGNIVLALLPTAALGKIIYEDDFEGGVQFTESMLLSVATTQLLKYSIDAERPNGEDNLSFPSGHTSAAFSSASFLQMRYGWAYGAPAYAAATFVAWSRVYSDNHYPRDVIAGAAIGVVSSFIFTDAYDKGVTVSPIAEKGIYGLQISSTFSSY